MISDVLADAVEKVRQYLDDPHYQYDGTYEGELRRRIEAVVLEMDQIRKALDTPPRAE